MREPIYPEDMCSMMTGSRAALNSRMNFHYEFILKTWLNETSGDFREKIVNMSYWTRQREKSVEGLTSVLVDVSKRIVMNTPSFEELDIIREADRLKMRIQFSRGAARREHEAALALLPSPPKNLEEWRRLVAEKEQLEKEITHLSEPLSLDNKFKFLEAIGFRHGETLAVISTEINESHCIVVPKVYLSGALNSLSSEDLCIYFACFIKDSGVNPEPNIDEISGFSKELDTALYRTDDIITELMEIEKKVGAESPGDYWSLSTGWIEVMMAWFRGDAIGKICEDYGIYEGNLMRTVLRISNIVEEVRNMATYFEHLDFIAKLGEIEKHLIREFVIDSLYIRV
jgi:superfamily II RNA helicase